MAETLSYDNTPDTEVLTTEEQDSLEAVSYTHLTLPTTPYV